MYKQKKNIIFLFVVISNLLPLILFAQDADNLLLKKANFIKNFSIFTTWPDTYINDSGQSTFTICILGETPLEKCLVDYYADVQIKDQKVKIIKINNVTEMNNCNLLFISDEKRENLIEILNFTKNLPVLTLSDSTGFAAMGVLINFVEEQGKLSFEINETALKLSGLYMSHLLLKEAKIINPVNK